MTTPITGFLHIIHSKRDLNGNVYWAFVYEDTETGKSVTGRISGGESNILAARFNLVEDSNSIRYTSTELKIREFNRTVKEYPYAGCHPLTIAAFIKQSVTNQWAEFYIRRDDKLAYPTSDFCNVITKKGGIITGTQEVKGYLCLFFKISFENLTHVHTDLDNLVRYTGNRIELKKD